MIGFSVLLCLGRYFIVVIVVGYVQKFGYTTDFFFSFGRFCVHGLNLGRIDPPHILANLSIDWWVHCIDSGLLPYYEVYIYVLL